MESSDSEHEDFNRLFAVKMESDPSVHKPAGLQGPTKLEELAGTVRYSVMCHVSCVMCHVSCVMCHVSFTVHPSSIIYSTYFSIILITN